MYRGLWAQALCNNRRAILTKLAKSKGCPGFILPVSPVTASLAHTTNRDTLALRLDLCRRCLWRAFLDLKRLPDGLVWGVLGGGGGERKTDRCLDLNRGCPCPPIVASPEGVAPPVGRVHPYKRTVQMQEPPARP
jgi:hypothetical protein